MTPPASNAKVKVASSPAKASKSPSKRSVITRAAALELKPTIQSIVLSAVPTATVIQSVASTGTIAHPVVAKQRIASVDHEATPSKIIQDFYSHDEFENASASSSNSAPSGGRTLDTSAVKPQLKSALKPDRPEPLIIPEDVSRIPQPWAMGRYWRPGAKTSEVFYLGNMDGKRFQNQREFEESICSVGSADGVEDGKTQHIQIPGILPMHCKIYPGISHHYSAQIIVQTSLEAYDKDGIDVYDDDTTYYMGGARTYVVDGAVWLQYKNVGEHDEWHRIAIFPTGVDNLIQDYFIGRKLMNRADGATFVGEPKPVTNTGPQSREMRRVGIKVKAGTNDIQEINLLAQIKAAAAHPGKNHIIESFADNAHVLDRRHTLIVMEFPEPSLRSRRQDPLWKKDGVLKEVARQMFSAIDCLHGNLICHSDIGLNDWRINKTTPLDSDGVKISLANFGRVRKLFPGSSLFKDDVKATVECLVELLEYHQEEEQNEALADPGLDHFCQSLSKVVESSDKDQEALAKLLKGTLLPDPCLRIGISVARSDKWFKLDSGRDRIVSPKKQLRVSATNEAVIPCPSKDASDDLEAVQVQCAGSSTNIIPPSPKKLPASPKKRSASARSQSASPKKRKTAGDDEDYKPPKGRPRGDSAQRR